jgi:hypothetical protein
MPSINHILTFYSHIISVNYILQIINKKNGHIILIETKFYRQL